MFAIEVRQLTQVDSLSLRVDRDGIHSEEGKSVDDPAKRPNRKHLFIVIWMPVVDEKPKGDGHRCSELPKEIV